MDQQLPDRVRLDGVVTVVDAKHVERHLNEEKQDDTVNEAVEQIAYADRIVLNKTDLVRPVRLDLDYWLSHIIECMGRGC